MAEIPSEVADRIATAILADADHLIATRTHPDQWEAAFRAAYLARRMFPKEARRRA